MDFYRTSFEDPGQKTWQTHICVFPVYQSQIYKNSSKSKLVMLQLSNVWNIPFPLKLSEKTEELLTMYVLQCIHSMFAYTAAFIYS